MKNFIIQAGLSLLLASTLSGCVSSAMKYLQEYEAGCAAGRAEDCYRASRQAAPGFADQPELVVKYEAQALEMFAAQCRARGPERCAAIGTEVQGPKGIPFLEQGCEGGVLLACVDAAERLGSTADTPARKAQVQSWYEKACDGGLTQGCLYLAAWHGAGRGQAQPVTLDKEKGERLRREACTKPGFQHYWNCKPDFEPYAALAAVAKATEAAPNAAGPMIEATNLVGNFPLNDAILMPDGRVIAVQYPEGLLELDPNLTRRDPPTVSFIRGTYLPGRTLEARLSPDGRRLALVAEARGNQAERHLWVYDFTKKATTGFMKMIPNLKRMAMKVTLRWFPDGDRLLIGHGDFSGPLATAIYDAAKDSIHRHCDAVLDNTSPEVTPDGKRILARRDGIWQLVDETCANATPIAGSSLSPAGTHGIAVKGQDLFEVIELATGQAVVQVQGRGPFYWVDNQRVLFRRTRPEKLPGLRELEFDTIWWLSVPEKVVQHVFAPVTGCDDRALPPIGEKFLVRRECKGATGPWNLARVSLPK